MPLPTNKTGLTAGIDNIEKRQQPQTGTVSELFGSLPPPIIIPSVQPGAYLPPTSAPPAMAAPPSTLANVQYANSGPNSNYVPGNFIAPPQALPQSYILTSTSETNPTYGPATGQFTPSAIGQYMIPSSQPPPPPANLEKVSAAPFYNPKPVQAFSMPSAPPISQTYSLPSGPSAAAPQFSMPISSAAGGIPSSGSQFSLPMSNAGGVPPSPQYGGPLTIPISLPGMPPITVSASLPPETLGNLQQQQQGFGVGTTTVSAAPPVVVSQIQPPVSAQH